MTKPKPTLQDLLNKCEQEIPISKGIKKWDEIRPVGMEYGSDEEHEDHA